jgi:UV DNA damage endonuclease|tara:strand:+ start:1860 stop:2867 length:1008 start_codon:yes stop_codon:yes gene_type:complete
MTKIKRIGFACKFSELTPKGIVSVPELNTRTTTAAWLNRQTKEVAVERLLDIVKHNVKSVQLLVEKVSTLDEHLRMVRLSSDLLPMFTHRDWSWFYRDASVVTLAETALFQAGETARRNKVRLSFHPGQFCVLASSNDNVVKNSIEEFEYHATMARWMGFGKTFQDFKINIHISGKAGPSGLLAAYSALSPEARNCITIENEEYTHGLEDCLSISNVLPVVLDIHHHFIREGEYIQVGDDRVKRVIDSWRGVRPTFHYSASREDVLVGHSRTTLPSLSNLLAEGYKKQKLRAHSDRYWNTPMNEWALEHLEWGDMMAECKHKNIASFELARMLKK